MILAVSPLLVVGAVVWIVLVVLIVVALVGASRTPWWEETSAEIDRLPEADPEDPRGRPSQDGRT